MSAVAQASREQLNQILEALRKDLDRISGVLSALGAPEAGEPAPEQACPDPRGLLSQRESEVFDFLLSGDPVSSVALALHISEHTVRNHVKAIYRKLGVNSRVQLVCQFAEAAPRAV